MEKMRSTRRRFVAAWDRVLDSYQDVKASLRWADYFNGGFLPVDAVSNVPLTIRSGQMPENLSGAYMRVSPNPAYWPPRKRTHLFDGDGMMHCVRIVDGSATYSCAFLETPRFKFEQKYGTEWFIRIGEMTGLSGLAKILSAGKKVTLAGLEDWEASGTANTAIGFTPDGKLWALNEAGPPFRFCLTQEGIPRSLGFDTLLGTHKKFISAHPKMDQRTGEILFHGRMLATNEFYLGRALDGQVTDCISLKVEPGWHHDMFITENFGIIVDGSLRFTPKECIAGKPLWQFQPDVKLRFGVFPRSCFGSQPTEDDVIWIECDRAADLVHTFYAYDDDNVITLWAPMCEYLPDGPSGGVLGDVSLSRMIRFVIDVKTKSVTIHEVPGAELYFTDFPRIRDDRMGLKVSSGFSGLFETGVDLTVTGILKWDFNECRLSGVIKFPDGVFGGEPVFFPSGNNSSDDDDGYIGMILWNTNTEESTFVLYDAKSFSPTPVVELSSPRRVPMGFHAAWITEEQLQHQLEEATSKEWTSWQEVAKNESDIWTGNLSAFVAHVSNK
jgi:carotenoid cleavage dioxygenase